MKLPRRYAVVPRIHLVVVTYQYCTHLAASASRALGEGSRHVQPGLIPGRTYPCGAHFIASMTALSIFSRLRSYQSFNFVPSVPSREYSTSNAVKTMRHASRTSGENSTLW